jgi:hypothetical protein
VNNFSNVGRESVASLRNSFDVSSARSFAVQHSSQLEDVLRQAALLDESLRPEPLHQLIFLEDVAIVFDEDCESLEELWGERYFLTMTNQKSLGQIKTKGSKLE